MLGVLLDRETLDRQDLDFGALTATLPRWEMHAQTRPEELGPRLAEATVAVSNKVVLDAAALAAAPALRLICVAATGTNNIDLEAARARGIEVCNVRAYATPSVVQHVFALILGLTRRLGEHRQAVAAGAWAASPHFTLLDYPMRELGGLTLGIVGHGELGRAVARTAECFGMRVRIAARAGAGDTRPGRVPLQTLLREVDVLSLHCPLTGQTRGLIGADELALMKPDALLINTARGGIVDEAALAEALGAGRLGGAGIDVLEEEPPQHGSPLLVRELPKLIVTPHVAWASREARQRLLDGVAANVRAWLAGTPSNRVTD